MNSEMLTSIEDADLEDVAGGATIGYQGFFTSGSLTIERGNVSWEFKTPNTVTKGGFSLSVTRPA